MEVWTCQTNQEYAKDKCSSISTEPVHNMAGSAQEEIHRNQGREVPCSNEIPKSNERRDYCKGSWNEVNKQIQI